MVYVEAWRNKGEENSAMLIADNHTLYPHFEANTYTIMYHLNGGNGGTTNNSSHTYDVDGYLTTNGYTRVGFTFAGWNTQADGKGTSYPNTAKVKNLVSSHNGSLTLYAQWNPILQDVVVCTVSEEKRLITDGDHVYETIRFENLSIAALSKEFGMTRVRLEIDLIASEVDDGYQDIWIHREAGTADGDRLYNQIFEHAPGVKDTTQKSHSFVFEFTISELFNSNEEICVEYGAHGADGDNWYLWFTQYTITIY